MFPNVRGAVPSPKATVIPVGWITHSIHTGNVQPVVTVSTAAQKRYIPMKTVICTATTQPVMGADKNWKAMDIPDGQTIPSAATHVPNADTPNLVPTPVHLQNTVI